MWRFLSNRYIYDGVSGRLFKSDPEQFSLVREAVERYQDQFSTIEFEGLGRYSKTRQENKRPNLSNDQHDFRHIVIVLTEKCNLTCAYCPYPTDPTRSHHLQGKYHSNSDIDKIVEFLKQSVRPATTLSFYGGEPLYRFKDMERIVRELHASIPEWQKRWSFTTNLTVFSEKIADFLIDCGAVMLVSLDGPKYIHDAKRIMFNGMSSFDKVIANLEFIKTHHEGFYKTCVGINAVISTTDFDDIDHFFGNHFSDLALIRFSVVQEFEGNGVDRPSVNNIKEQLESWATRRLSTLEQLDDLSKFPLLLDFCRKNFLPIMSRSNVQNERKRFTSCQPGEKLVINSDMTFGVCEKTERIAQGSVSSGFSGCDDVASQFADMLKDRCRYCFASPMCSVCYATIWDGKELSRPRLDAYCSDFRGRMDRLLSLYVELRERFDNFDERFRQLSAEGMEVFED
ncbi:MAG: radical SAM protein [Halobacteriota archaeon]